MEQPIRLQVQRVTVDFERSQLGRDRVTGFQVLGSRRLRGESLQGGRCRCLLLGDSRGEPDREQDGESPEQNEPGDLVRPAGHRFKRWDSTVSWEVRFGSWSAESTWAGPVLNPRPIR